MYSSQRILLALASQSWLRQGALRNQNRSLSLDLLPLLDNNLAPKQLIYLALRSPHLEPKRLPERIRGPEHAHALLIQLVRGVLRARYTLCETRAGDEEGGEQEGGREHDEHVDEVVCEVVVC